MKISISMHAEDGLAPIQYRMENRVGILSKNFGRIIKIHSGLKKIINFDNEMHLTGKFWSVMKQKMIWSVKLA